MGIPANWERKNERKQSFKCGGINHSISVSTHNVLVCQHAWSIRTWLNTGKTGWNILQTSLGQRAIAH